MKLHQWSLIVLMALCGCDGLGKGFPRPVPTARKAMVTPPAPPIAPSPPLVAEPAVESVDAAPPTEQSSPEETTALKETREPEPMPAAASLVLYEDSFADVGGSVRRKTDGKQQSGESPPASRTVYTFQDVPMDGVLTTRIFEDNVTAGPDGEPGVLAVAWDEIPKKLAWSGFVYLGGAQAGKRMTLPKLQAARTKHDLHALRVRFRYRGINPSSDSPVQMPINCRLEPVVNDSYKHRIDFGTLVATGEWQSFDLSLADGTNLDACLKLLAADNPANFKIVWGQSVPIDQYRAGDTLLIDDISVVGVPVPAGG